MKTDRLSFGLNIHTCDTIKKIVKGTQHKENIESIVELAAKDGIKGDLHFSFPDSQQQTIKMTLKLEGQKNQDTFVKPFNPLFAINPSEANKPDRIFEIIREGYLRTVAQLRNIDYMTGF